MSNGDDLFEEMLKHKIIECSHAAEVLRQWWQCTGCDWVSEPTYDGRRRAEDARVHQVEVIEKFLNGLFEKFSGENWRLANLNTAAREEIDAWREWSNSLAMLLPEGDEARYSNPEGAQEGIIYDCLKAYIGQLAEVAAAAKRWKDEGCGLGLTVAAQYLVEDECARQVLAIVGGDDD